MEAETLPPWTATWAGEYRVIGDCHGACYGFFGIGSGRHVGFGDELERPSRDLDCVGLDIHGTDYGLYGCFGFVYVLDTGNSSYGISGYGILDSDYGSGYTLSGIGVGNGGHGNGAHRPAESAR